MRIKLVFGSVVCCLAGLVACGSATPTTGASTLSVATPVSEPALDPGVFTAFDDRAGQIDLFKLSSGRLVHKVRAIDRSGLMLDATALDGQGHVWVTLSKPAACTSDIAGCGPKPNTCAGSVDIFNTIGGSMRAVLTMPASASISDAQPSPDGRYLAFLTGTCGTDYDNQHIEVIDLSNRQTWTMGTGLVVCHSLRSMSWTRSGQSLAVAYGRSAINRRDSSNARFGAGMCQLPEPPVLDVIPAFTTQPGVKGDTARAEAGCEIDATTATGTGYAAVEGCGGHNGIGLDVRFLTYSPTLKPVGSTSIGACGNGAELAANPKGTQVLGTTYQYCGSPGTAAPQTVTFIADHVGVHIVYKHPNGGIDKFRAISW